MIVSVALALEPESCDDVFVGHSRTLFPIFGSALFYLSPHKNSEDHIRNSLNWDTF